MKWQHKCRWWPLRDQVVAQYSKSDVGAGFARPNCIKMFDPKTHHRRSIRLKNYDYSHQGLYFITICTHDKKCIFGRLRNGEMILNEYGRIVKECWESIPGHYLNTKLYEFVIMPNHIHGIIGITDVGAGSARPNDNGRANRAPTLGSMVAWFKYKTTKIIDLDNKLWQRNYYEHIIRDSDDYEQIASYIVGNPQTWDADSLFSKQLDGFNKQFDIN